MGESDSPFVMRYGGGDGEGVSIGDLGARPGNTPGGNVDLTGEILGSACSGIVGGLSRTEVAAASECSAAVLGSCANDGVPALRFDISVSCDRFL